MENASVKNYRSLFNFLRKKIDKKWCSNNEYFEPIIVPNDYYFHIGEDKFFATFDEYFKYYKEAGLYQKGAPRIVMLTGNINLQNSNEEHINALINSLEDKGLNVFPINSFSSKKIDLIKAVNPDLIIYSPHGRFLMGGADDGEALLKELKVPLLAPITVSDKYEDWVKSSQGMTAGGMTSMSVVLPELDGAIAPFAVSAQFEKNGKLLFDEIPLHTDKFSRLVSNFTKLQKKDNKDKNVAIYYYKGVGKGSLAAADLEAISSLYNTLKTLRKKGYNVEGLPKNVKDFEKLIQTQGSVLGAYAHGAYDEFIKNGNPALVSKNDFYKWANNQIADSLIKDIEIKYGEFPGEYMSTEKDGIEYLTVARIRFGNVTILPQPMASTGGDIDKITHGVKGAPAYPYVASYLWTKNEFKADAIIHFGTHGSLEFIPGKQIALSDYDWTDALISDLPHFYIYTINNIGEGIIAKRRSYATLLSHLTAPFFRSELYDDLAKIKNMVHKMNNMEDGPLKQNYRESITKLSKTQNIISALGIDSTRTLNDKEIEGSKVSDGLYTLGEKYTKKELNNTARLMSIDPIRYSLANLDLSRGKKISGRKIESSDLENLSFMAHNYDTKTEKIIDKALNSKHTYHIFKTLLTKDEYSLMLKDSLKKVEKDEMMRSMMSMAFQEKKDSLAKFLDANGDIIEKEPRISDMSMMEKMSFMSSILENNPEAQKLEGKEKMAFAKKLLAQMEEKEKNGEKVALPKGNKPKSMMDRMAEASTLEDAMKDEELALLNSIITLKDAILNVAKTKEDLYNSTDYEENALEDALNGKYILPSSAGDPIINPKAVPTGKNFYSVNPEITPTVEAWKVGKRLAESILETEFETNGKYPEKISFTLWSSDFISSEGATIAQILYLLGIEPLRDGFGYIRSLKLIPSSELGRPRIDVVVQTSGQLRDIAASRLKLINDAVIMAASDTSSNNFVNKGLKDAEALLLSKGFSLIDARKYSKQRVFGGVNGNYGTGIMGMVEKSDSWDDRKEIGKRYISGMGAAYSANGSEEWGEYKEGVFEAALLNTSVVVQPRSSNTWGPLSLDHVYEFMGGLSSAVETVTGNDPRGYFNDFRNPSRAKAQELKEAIGVETNSTVFNPKYIKQMMAEGPSGMSHFSETFRNTFGWNAMKPSAIDQHIWNKYYDVYVKDSHNLGLKNQFKSKNPYALEEMTAVMLEAARKEMWKASPEQIQEVSELHASLLKEHDAACSGFVCDNAKLKDYIASKVSPSLAKDYKAKISEAREVKIEQNNSKKNVVLKKDAPTDSDKSKSEIENKQTSPKTRILMIIGIILGFIILWVLSKKLIKR